MAEIIQSYGLFWKADDVFWGKGPNRGALLGVRASGRRSKPIDFRDQVGNLAEECDEIVYELGWIDHKK